MTTRHGFETEVVDDAYGLSEFVSSTKTAHSLNYSNPSPFDPLIDSVGNIYLSRFASYLPTYCFITGENSAYANNVAGGPAWIVAGTRSCGFSGDGGQARNAEIGNTVYQLVFDLSGNLYFSDATNQRVRRIDTATGIIHTIAGTGSAGYTGDGGPATSATLRNPTESLWIPRDRYTSPAVPPQPGPNRWSASLDRTVH